MAAAGTRSHSFPAAPGSARRSRVESGPRSRRHRSGTRPRLLGARVAALPPRQGRDRERDLHHPADPGRLHRRADRGALPRPRAGRHVRRAPTAVEQRQPAAGEPVDALRQHLHRAISNVFVLGAANQLGRDEFLRLLYGARVSLEVALLLDARGDGDRRDARRGRRLLPRLARHDHLAHHRDHDGVPGAALHRSRWPRRSARSSTRHVRGLLPARGGDARADLHASSAGSIRRGSCARRCSRFARRSSSRRRG